MADTVRYLMEEMVPELEDMVKQQYFRKQEVKQIVKRRQDFEYLLKRKAALKEDFLRYIEYESKLDALRVHRRQALGLEGKKKKSLADFAIVRRIHFIFERAVRKFKTDLGLWTAWLEFCRGSNSNRRLGRVVARALQIHPTEPGLWVYAAAWEFEANGNPNAARALMQQGLRMCRHSQKMWLDYFDLELMYVEKEVARRRILGLDVPDDDDSIQQQQQEAAGAAHGGDAPTAAAAGRKRRRGAAADAAAGADSAAVGSDAEGGQEDGEGPESTTDAAAAAGELTLNQVLLSQQDQQQQDQQEQPGGLADAQAAVKAVLTGAIARLVFENALKAASAAAAKGVPSSSNYLRPQVGSSGGSSDGSNGSSNGSSLAFRAGFLQVLARYTSPGVGRLRAEIVDSIRHDFVSDPAAADLLARITCDPSDPSASTEDFQAATQEYEHLLGHSAAPSTAAAAATAGGGGKGRAAKRQKKIASAPSAAADSTAAEQAVQLPREAVQQVYRLYCGYLEQRLRALLQDEAHALAAAAVAQQLFKQLLAAHSAGAADVELYGLWVRVATQLQQRKVALKAARLATEAHPRSATAWQTRVELEAKHVPGSSTASAPLGSNRGPQQQQQLFVLVTQALKQVPAAEAEQIWQQGFDLAEALAAGGSSSQLTVLQKQLVSAVTTAAVKGPSTGGLGAVAGRCLQAVWKVSGAAAARKLWQQLLLLPPAGGDMFFVMVQLEQQTGGDGAAAAVTAAEPAQQQQQQPLAPDAAKRVRAVYEAWASAYGSSDAGPWVDWALFEQQQGKAGAGKVYWRAVKTLEEPEEFIAEYRQQIGAA